MRRPIAAPGSLGLCGLGLVLALAYLLGGGWPSGIEIPLGLPGQGMVLALDGLSGFFLLLLMAVGAAVSAAALEDHAAYGASAPCFPAFLGAMTLTLLAGDAFALVLGFELMSLGSFALVLTRHEDEGVRAAALLYIGMAALGAACLAGLGAGLYDSVTSLATGWQCQRRFEPGMSASRRCRGRRSRRR